jgi:hypothetical protein
MEYIKIKVTSFIIGIFLAISLHAGPAQIMKLSEIKPGMQGIGKTIYKGTKIETFNFKVLGVVEKFVPDKDMIIVDRRYYTYRRYNQNFRVQ